MKLASRFFAGLAFLGLTATAVLPAFAQQQADPMLVSTSNGAKIDITIYGARLAQVNETRKLQLKAGRNLIQLTGISSQFFQDSLRIVDSKGPGSFTFRNATFQPANLSSESVLAKFIGKEVEVYRRLGASASGGGEWIRGKLRTVSGDRYIIDTASGAQLVSSSDIRLLGPLPDGLSNSASLVIEVDVTVAGDYDLSFMYKTNGLGWSAKHGLVFNDDKSQLDSWQTTVAVRNDTGVTFPEATLRLTAAASLGEGANQGVARMGAAPASAKSFDSSPEASVEDLADQKVFVLPGKVSLQEGQSKQIVMFEHRNVPVQREYFIPAHAQGGFGADAPLSPVMVRLVVDNNSKKGMGKAIPAGSVEVYQLNSAGLQQQTGSARLANDKSVDEVFSLVIGTANDVRFQKTLVSQKRDPASNPAGKQASQNDPLFDIQVWQVKVVNAKNDREIVVKCEFALHQNMEFVGKFKPTKKTARLAESELVVPKAGQTTLDYELRVQVR